jgi:solute carrier family 25 carnitine/acylcarnitine transporter 20/29
VDRPTGRARARARARGGAVITMAGIGLPGSVAEMVRADDSSAAGSDFARAKPVFEPVASLSGALELRGALSRGAGGSSWMVDLIAGFSSGCAIVVVGHPFETLRTRMQTTGGRAPGAMLQPQAPGFRSIARQMLTDMGPAGLYRGALPPLMTSGCISMCIWTSFESIKRTVHGPGQVGDAPLATVWLSAACAPLLCMPLLVPQQRLSKLLQVNERRGDFTTVRACARAILRKEGLRGLYRGGSALAVQDFFGRANYVTTYETCKRVWAHVNDGADLSTSQRMLAGAASGTMGWIFTYPIDCVKARLMTQAPGEVRWDTVRSCLHQTWQEGGLRGMYRGILLCLVRGVPVAMVALPTYDVARGFWSSILLSE